MRQNGILLILVFFLSFSSFEVFGQQNNSGKKELQWAKSIKAHEKSKNAKGARARENLRKSILGLQSSKSTVKSNVKTTKSSNTTKNNTNNKVQNYACPQCGGVGNIRPVGYENDIMAPNFICPSCNGKKYVTYAEYQQMIKNYVEFQKMIQPTRKSGPVVLKGVCPSCGGSGRCSQCAGKGLRIYEKTYTGGDGVIGCAACNQSGRCTTCNGTGRGI